MDASSANPLNLKDSLAISGTDSYQIHVLDRSSLPLHPSPLRRRRRRAPPTCGCSPAPWRPPSGNQEPDSEEKNFPENFPENFPKMQFWFSDMYQLLNFLHFPSVTFLEKNLGKNLGKIFGKISSFRIGLLKLLHAWKWSHILCCRSGLIFDDLFLVYVEFSIQHLLSDWVHLGAKFQIKRAHTHTHPYTTIDL